jgi:ADP-ribose pyrophosphatase YjhB (NUDIX family)
MSREERESLLNKDFHRVWHGFWKSSPKSRSDYQTCKQRFDTLVGGYRLRLLDGDIAHVSLRGLLKDAGCGQDPEWGFPKGRKIHRNEPEIECAVRELREETGLDPHSLSDVGFERVFETYSGSNSETYHHVYFTAFLRPGAPSDTRVCEKEISRAAWVTRDEVLRLMERRPERCVMFRELTSSRRFNVPCGESESQTAPGG